MSNRNGSVNELKNFGELANAIEKVNNHFLDYARRQVNIALTLRNWFIGLYIFEYEQKGEDRAGYGDQLMKQLAESLKGKGLKTLAERTLYLCKKFYLAYPRILQSLPAELYQNDFESLMISQSPIAKSDCKVDDDAQWESKGRMILARLSFTHLIELLRADSSIKRTFYEVQAIKNNWSVRELQRAMNSLLYERTGLSTDKEAVLEEIAKREPLKAENVFRNPYLLEFLGLDDKPSYSESDLEQAIINHLQTFLLEMGRGFCFESRQKRITFDNTHYRIDLVFYHRILKCHILLDLKIGEFTHADAGQMNVYLNYFKENEMLELDNPPIGIILCADKNKTLVKYATAGLSEKVFVSKYLINLPTEEELNDIIKEEQLKIG